MKILFLISLTLLFGFANYGVFAETEITGILGITDVYSTEPIPHSYQILLYPDDQTGPYKLNPQTMSHGVIDWSGERVRVTVAEANGLPQANSLKSPQFLDITSIGLVDQPSQNSFSNVISQSIVVNERSVTLLSKYSDIPQTPTEDAGSSPGQFILPADVAVDGSGNIYTIEWGADTGEGHRVQKFDSNGDFLFKFGRGGDGGDPGEFFGPRGIEVDSEGNIYVVEYWGDRVQKFDPNGVFLLEFGSTGSGDAQFSFPFGIAVDSSDNVYVVDLGNHRIQKFDSAGAFQGWLGGCTAGANCLAGPVSDGFLCTAATCGASVPSVANGGFNSPYGIAIHDNDQIFVVQGVNDSIHKFDSSGGFLTRLDPFTSTGSAEGQFMGAHGIAVDASHVYVSDTGNHRIQKFDTSLAFVSMWGWGVDDGTAALQTCTSGCQAGLAGSGVGQLNSPEGITSGSILVADSSNNRIKKFSDTGVFESSIGFDGSLAHDASYYDDLFYTSPGSLKNYYDTSSYGNYIWDGEVSGWQTVSGIMDFYATDPSNFDGMIGDAIAAHDGIVDFCMPNPVTNLILVFNEKVVDGTPDINGDVNTAFGSVGTWGTNPWATGDGCSITVSVTWEPDHGGFFCCGQTLDRGIGVTAHELGHNRGLNHTPPPPGLWSMGVGDPYHDPNSVMSNNKDREGPSALIMAQRDDEGWVDSGNKIEVADGNSATVTLDFSNEPQGGVNPQMITVPLPDNTSYIIEGHTEGLFNDVPQDRTGIMIYKKIPGGNQYSYLTSQDDKDALYSLVATDGTDSESDFDTAILEVGESFEDVPNSVTITAQSIGNSITVFVSNNASQCAPQSGQNWEISEDCTLTGDVTADMNITVQANSVLTIPDGMTVFFDPGTFSITVMSGGGILIQQGGSIQTTP